MAQRGNCSTKAIISKAKSTTSWRRFARPDNLECIASPNTFEGCFVAAPPNGAWSGLPRISGMLLSSQKQILHGVWALAKQCWFTRLS
jgi:hypothetical protein